MTVKPFHLAIPVKSLEPCRTFYREILQCEQGRSSENCVDFNFFGHQLVIHQKASYTPQPIIKNDVDGHGVPVPHFGVVLSMKDWKSLSERLNNLSIEFIIKPYVRFEGEVGEQATMFFQDPEGNALEFKAFNDESQIFAK